MEGAKSVRIMHEDIAVRCKVKVISGYSAHADQPRLIEWLSPMRATLEKAFVVQGEPQASATLASKIEDELAIKTHVPQAGEVVDL